MIGDHFVDDPTSTWRFDRVIDPGGPCNQRLPKRPASTARPRRAIEWQRGSQGFTAFATEEGPGYRQVARRVAYAAGAEVDDGTEATLFDQQVARCDIAMDPNRSSTPGAG